MLDLDYVDKKENIATADAPDEGRRQAISTHTTDPWFQLPVSSQKLGEKYTHDDVIKWKHFLRYWPFVPE